MQGLADYKSARLLAWALLADPWGEEEQWEAVLRKEDDTDDQPLLLR